MASFEFINVVLRGANISVGALRTLAAVVHYQEVDENDLVTIFSTPRPIMEEYIYDLLEKNMIATRTELTGKWRSFYRATPLGYSLVDELKGAVKQLS